jgi:hypothetical protein
MSRFLPFIRFVWLLLGAVPPSAFGAALQTRNVFLITTDGLRWQEVFTGAEEALMDKENGGVSKTNELRAAYWRATPEARRETLMPFLWGTIARHGQIRGNRSKNSEVRVTNGHNFSFPGYSEFLTGVADARIDSNDPKPNPNVNVFQWLHGKSAFHGKVAAAVSWAVIPWVLNADQARFPVWSAFPLPEGAVPARMPAAFIELLERSTPIWSDVSLDTFTVAATKEIIRQQKPRALYVAFGETDDWAHEGRYDRYLGAAHNFDRFIGELWTLAQSMPEYRGHTTFLLATDHGRGSGPVAWKSHSAAITEAAYIWTAAIGPDTEPLGERENTPLATQGQIAASIASFLGEDFNVAMPKAAPPLPDLIKK